jgi:hypothetical protein
MLANRAAIRLTARNGFPKAAPPTAACAGASRAARVRLTGVNGGGSGKAYA